MNILIDLNVTHSLQHDIRGYSITQLPEVLFVVSATYISITETNITTLPRNLFAKTSISLNTLKLCCNQLRNVPGSIYCMYELLLLDISRNKLKRIGNGTKCSRVKLKELNLSHNLISRVNTNNLRCFFSLEILKLSDNRVEFLDAALFDHMVNVSVVELRNNRLTQLGVRPYAALLAKPRLRWITLRGNRFVCDCSMTWLYEAVLNTPTPKYSSRVNSTLDIIGDILEDSMCVDADAMDEGDVKYLTVNIWSVTRFTSAIDIVNH